MQGRCAAAEWARFELITKVSVVGKLGQMNIIQGTYMLHVEVNNRTFLYHHVCNQAKIVYCKSLQ